MVHVFFFFFFFNDTATTEIYPLSLHDALPIFKVKSGGGLVENIKCSVPPFGLRGLAWVAVRWSGEIPPRLQMRSEEHTSELQSQSNLVCRLLLEKKKNSARLVDPSTFQHRVPE